ncbi:uncharacterized protein LOC113491783 isoform X2 [Trichoplusia ni]|uniref:Uncharacterized protein LOC113491783 isoform X2 n=1 Tax=Trichoplusia ni TaxID=7111 RepID=A0A7E5V8Z1_TRINI|nr:uncharacterized protein LOC113491783 isoform X2 [Trichoplusia ni]
MSKLPVIVFAVITVASVKCLAEHLAPDARPSRTDEVGNFEPEPEELERSASPQVYAAVNSRPRPGVYATPNKIQLVECYACTDCPTILQNTTTKYCPYTNDYSRISKCVVYAEKYIQSDRPLYIRGCASERGTCSEITRGHEHNEKLVKLLSCVDCDGDRCNTNGVHRSIPDLTTAILVVVISPLIYKYALS